MNSLEEKTRRINSYLRHHTEYQVTISLYSVYGCLQVEITRSPGNTRLFFDFGDTLEHRLDKVIAFFGLDKEQEP